jgi:hypothetical protein
MSNSVFLMERNRERKAILHAGQIYPHHEQWLLRLLIEEGFAQNMVQPRYVIELFGAGSAHERIQDRAARNHRRNIPTMKSAIRITPSRDIEDWHPWFAWCPVRVDLDAKGRESRIVWLESLERRYVYVMGCDSYFRYRFPQAWQ